MTCDNPHCENFGFPLELTNQKATHCPSCGRVLVEHWQEPSWTCPRCQETVVASAGTTLEELEAISWRHECIVGAAS